MEIQGNLDDFALSEDRFSRGTPLRPRIRETLLVIKEIITKYNMFIEEPLMQEFCMQAMCVNLGRLAQGYKDTKGTTHNTLHVPQ